MAWYAITVDNCLSRLSARDTDLIRCPPEVPRIRAPRSSFVAVALFVSVGFTVLTLDATTLVIIWATSGALFCALAVGGVLTYLAFWLTCAAAVLVRYDEVLSATAGGGPRLAATFLTGFVAVVTGGFVLIGAIMRRRARLISRS